MRGKRLPNFLVVALLFGLILGYPDKANANLLENPGFDAGEFRNAEFYPWTMVSGSECWSWEYYMKRNGRWGIFISPGDRIEQRVPVTSYTNYKLIVPVKIAAFPGTGWGQVIFRLYVDGVEIFTLASTLSSSYFSYPHATFNSEDRDTVTVGFSIDAIGRVTLEDIILVETETIRPAILSATAYDGEVWLPGDIDDDDYVLIVFSEPTNTPKIDVSNIDDVLNLTEHSWLSETGQLWSTTWNPRGDTLRIDLYAVIGEPPTVQVGDKFRPDNHTITDEYGNLVYRDLITIEGSFYGGPVGPMVSETGPASEQILNVFDPEKTITTEYYRYQIK